MKFFSILKNAADGYIYFGEKLLKIANDKAIFQFSEISHRGKWFFQLNLNVTGELSKTHSPIELSSIDNLLRASTPPFDGLSEAATWLGLHLPYDSSKSPSIDININPPVDLIFADSSLKNDVLTLVLHAHPQFETNRVTLAVRASPGKGLKARQQLAPLIQWKEGPNNIQMGEVIVNIEQADSVLVMLLIGEYTLRRQWITDQNKARNNRLLAIQHFDGDLKRIMDAALINSDSIKFENAIAAILFLHGFSPCVQLETDSPDLIVTTPGGRLIIIECTIRNADLITKTGKLVDRRGSLLKSLNASGHPAEVIAVSVCRLPKEQTLIDVNIMRANKVILITEEGIQKLLLETRHPVDPDELINNEIPKI